MISVEKAKGNAGGHRVTRVVLRLGQDLRCMTPQLPYIFCSQTVDQHIAHRNFSAIVERSNEPPGSYAFTTGALPLLTQKARS